MKILVTGATGLTGTFFLERLAIASPGTAISCLTRPTSDRSELDRLNLKITYYTGDSGDGETWARILAKDCFDTIIHLVQLRQVPTILNTLKKAEQTPRLIIIGTTGVYSRYNQYSAEYREAESSLSHYSGAYCLLRPTMIYGSPRDKNLHKLIKFCHRYRFFPVFGPGNNLIQPIHADDIAATLLTVLQRPDVRGSYDLSGATIISFRELLELVGKLLDRPVRQLSLSLGIGMALATFLENTLGKKSPVRVEQILRLQEDKAYPHEAAKVALDFSPRTLEIGLQQEITLMRSQGLIR